MPHLDAIVMPAPSQPPIYEVYAGVYDRTGQTHFSVLMELYLREILRMHRIDGNRLLELACGTGTLAMMMAEASWDVIGLDRSEAMLEEARAKTDAADVEVRFCMGDMTGFALDTPVDLVTCCYDSLNYLLEDDHLRMCFRSVHAALVPGGIFCFDLATDYFLRHYWRGVETYTDAGYSQVMESSYDDTQGHSTLVLTGTMHEPDAPPRRFRE